MQRVLHSATRLPRASLGPSQWHSRRKSDLVRLEVATHQTIVFKGRRRGGEDDERLIDKESNQRDSASVKVGEVTVHFVRSSSEPPPPVAASRDFGT